MERIDGLDDRSIETSLFEMHREKEWKTETRKPKPKRKSWKTEKNKKIVMLFS